MVCMQVERAWCLHAPAGLVRQGPADMEFAGNLMQDAVKNLVNMTLLAVFLCAFGCYNNKSVNEFLPDPRTPVATPEYRVYPPDLLLISSDNMREFRPELGKRGMQILVMPDGKINVPLLGSLFVAGKTVREIERDILRASAKYYSEATVNVDVMRFDSQKFYVMGEVSNPGPKKWTGRDTVLDAVAQAGLTPTSWSERIIVVRGDSPIVGGVEQGGEYDKGYYYRGIRRERAGSARKKMVVNIMAMAKYGDMSNNIILMPNDVVYVQTDPCVAVGRKIWNMVNPLDATREGVMDLRSIFDPNYDNGVWVSGGNSSE